MAALSDTVFLVDRPSGVVSARPLRLSGWACWLLVVRALCLVVGILGLAGGMALAQGVQAIAVPLARPAAVAFDGAGNLYIAETNNHVIRKVDPSGVMTTVAGTGVQGFAGDGGPAGLALLDSPTGVAIDAGQNVYIADTHNQRIREIAAATGTITTIAGTGTVGWSGDGGAATAGAIDSPDGLAVDSVGRLYLADTHNQRIRMVNPVTGMITTVAGSGVVGSAGDGGAAAVAALAMPHGVTVDAAGNLYFADTNNQRLRRVDTVTGVITTLAGDGVQGFAGDGGAATAASVDSPRMATLTPAGLVTLADTGNGRVRQIGGDATIQTVAGLGESAAGTLTIVGPAVIGYGSGSVSATLSSATLGTGSIVFLDVSGATPVPVGTVALNNNVAVLPTADLTVGVHDLLATYGGDGMHSSAESAVLAVRIAPAPVVAAAVGASVSYGMAIPVLTGTLTGVLARDTGAVSVVYSTTAAAGSMVGSYAITAALAGPAAGNYTLTLAPGSGAVAITRAASAAVLAGTASGLTLGAETTLSATVTSTTSGMPGGSVVLQDGGVQIQSARLSSAGVAVFNVSFSTPGTHSLTAVYLGNVDFLPAASAVTAETVAGAAAAAGTDFSLAASGATTQTVPEGTAATFGFTLVEQGAGLPSQVSLSAAGLPIGAVGSFSPTYVPPGALQTAVTLTIQTPTAGVAQPGLLRKGAEWASVVWAGVWLPWLLCGKRRRELTQSGWSGRRWLALICLGALGMALSGCGNRVVSYGSTDAAVSQSYSITVTGTGTSSSGAVLTHAVGVTLVME